MELFRRQKVLYTKQCKPFFHMNAQQCVQRSVYMTQWGTKSTQNIWAFFQVVAHGSPAFFRSKIGKEFCFVTCTAQDEDNFICYYNSRCLCRSLPSCFVGAWAISSTYSYLFKRKPIFWQDAWLIQVHWMSWNTEQTKLVGRYISYLHQLHMFCVYVQHQATFHWSIMHIVQKSTPLQGCYVLSSCMVVLNLSHPFQLSALLQRNSDVDRTQAWPFSVSDPWWLSIPTAWKLNAHWEGKWRIHAIPGPVKCIIYDGTRSVL